MPDDTGRTPKDSEEVQNARIKEKWAESHKRLLARLEALGLEPNGFLPEDDPRIGEVKQAHSDYQADLDKVRARLPGPSDQMASPVGRIDALLQGCQVERTVLTLLRHVPPSKVDWQQMIRGLWQPMEDFVRDFRGTHPKQPRVSTAEQASKAINKVVRWCEKAKSRWQEYDPKLNTNVITDPTAPLTADEIAVATSAPVHWP